MSIRLGPGPVFVFESLILARRRQVYAGRALFVLVMLIGLFLAWQSAVPDSSLGMNGGAVLSIDDMASAGETFFCTLAGIQLAMVMLVAPAATAGAICQDRARQIFAHLAVTDLSDTEIVLGKLCSRLAPTLGVLACSLPVAALAALLGGIDPQAIVSLFAISVAIAVLGSSLALALSVRAAKTYEVMVAAMGFWILWLLILPIWYGVSTTRWLISPPDWFAKTNPVLLVYAPYIRPGFVTPKDVAVFVAMVFLVSAGLIAFTISDVRRNVLEPPRPVKKRAIKHRPRRKALLHFLPGPSLDGNPILWREWYCNRPSKMARAVSLGYMASALPGAAIVFYVHTFENSANPNYLMPFVITVTTQFIFGLLVQSILAASCLAEERSRGTLDAVLATPLSTRSIVWGKWIGIYRTALWMAILPGVCSVTVACVAFPFRARLAALVDPAAGVMSLTILAHILAPALVVCEMLAFGAAITSMGLALATWIPGFGRAVVINIVIFGLFAIGWPLVVVTLIAPQLAELRSSGSIAHDEPIQFGLLTLSPTTAPVLALDWLLESDESPPWTISLFALTWCALAGASAAVILWATVKTFDRCLGRSTLTRRAPIRNR